jgi:hypothetical protein
MVSSARICRRGSWKEDAGLTQLLYDTLTILERYKVGGTLHYKCNVLTVLLG